MSTDTMARTVIMIRADEFVPGLYITWDLPDGDGGWTAIDPLRIEAVEPHGDTGVLFRFADHAPTPFARDQQLGMVCAPVEHPAWCRDPVKCESQRDSDGTIYHTSTYRTLDLANDAGQTVSVWVSVNRLDDPDGEQGPVSVSLVLEGGGCHDGLDMTAADARALAQLLADAATDADRTVSGEVGS